MSSTKKISYYQWIFAIGVAVLLHGLFLFLFSTAKENKIENHKIYKPSILLLTIDKKDTLPTSKNLIFWLLNNDPSLIVLPNEQYGYSYILLKPFDFQLDKFHQNINDLLLSQKFPYLPPTVPLIRPNSERLENRLSDLDLVKQPYPPKLGFIPVEKIKQTNIDFPYAEDIYTGKIIPLELTKIPNIKEIIKKENPKGPTEVNIILPKSNDFFPEVKIISSSGSSELDKMAIQNMITGNLLDKLDKSYASKQLTIKIYWQLHNQTK